MKALGYVRVSTAEQARSGLGLEAQSQKVTAEIDRRGWELVELLVDDGYTGKHMNRPGIQKALRMLAAGDADALIVHDLDRLARGIVPGIEMMALSENEGWALIIPGWDIDTTTADGRMMANIKLTIAQWEREKLGERTKAALAVLKASGKRLGRPVGLPQPVRVRIGTERAEGRTLQAIADGLTADGVPTRTPGAEWHRSSVRHVLSSLSTDQEMAAINAA